MKKRIFTLTIIFLTITSGINIISAENITETEILRESEEFKIKETEENKIGDEVKSTQDGHFNISFDDGYNGYCIDYGKNEADKGDIFIVQNTTSAINHNNGEPIGNYLKTFFVEYHDIAVKDKYATQKIIWGFSDDFDYQKDLINEIKKISNNQIIPDYGFVKKINNTTEAIFYFEVLSALESESQNFFAYKIDYNPITEKTNNNNTPINNSITNNTAANQTTNNTQRNETTNASHDKTLKEPVYENKTDNITVEKNNDNTLTLLKHATGNSWTLILLILLIGTILFIRPKRD